VDDIVACKVKHTFVGHDVTLQGRTVAEQAVGETTWRTICNT